MTIDEREEFLSTLAESLMLSASIAKHDSDPIWREMDELGRRINVNLETIAEGDAAKASDIVVAAVYLLAKFEHNSPGSPTIH